MTAARLNSRCVTGRTVIEMPLPRCPFPAAASRVTLTVSPYGQCGRRLENGQEAVGIGVQAVRLPEGAGRAQAQCGVPETRGGGARELVLQPGAAAARRRGAAPDP